MELNGFKIKDYNYLNFDLKGKTEGKVSTTCPICSHKRKPENQKKPCVSVYLDTGFYDCHHECGRGQLHTYEKKEDTKKYIRPVLSTETSDYSDDLVKYMLDVRKINKNTLKHFKIIEKGKWFSFPYYIDGELINVKSRTQDKKFQMAKGAERVFYNLDAIRTEKEVIICEGEFEVLALYECGIYNAISVPNGFNAKGAINLSYLDDYYKYFENKEKIILATDNDEAGEHGKKELIRRLGSDKCYTIDLKDCKDPNDYLVKYGAIELAKVIDEAKPLPLENVETVKDYIDDLEDFYLNGMSKGYTCGINNLDDIYSTELGQYTIVTGPPQCFAREQKILTKKGSKDISTLKKGDLVLSYNHKENKNEYKKVLNTMVNKNTPDKIYKIKLKNGTVIKCTENHRFFNGTSYVKIKELLLNLVDDKNIII